MPIENTFNPDVDYTKAKSWPYAEAKRLLSTILYNNKDVVTFETGYGPSGLPHIGTFGEVFRTSLVMHAYRNLAQQMEKESGKPAKPAKLIVYSDDMDGLRKVPMNVPNKEMLQENIGKPLTSVPDPYGKFGSFAEHNNAQLKAFLDQFGFEYEFCSATEEYKSGRLDESLLSVLNHYEEISTTIKNTLGDERRQTYSPFMPICPVTGNVLEDAVIGVDKEKKTIRFLDSNGNEAEVPVTGGNVKLQWKVDWPARWKAKNIDYEMCGFDLKNSYDLGRKIMHIMNDKAPQGMIYQLFVDENEEKISKSKGNGVSVEEWLKYGIEESMEYFLYDNPTSTKKLHFGAIQQSTDKYLEALNTYHKQTSQQQIDNVAHHIHNGKPPYGVTVNYGMILNVLSATGIDDSEALLNICGRYKNTEDDNQELLARMSKVAISNYRDLILPNKHFRQANEKEVLIINELKENLLSMEKTAAEEDFQTVFYEVGKKYYGKENLRQFFSDVYEITLGQTQGPRPGSLTKIIGVDNMAQLLNRGLIANTPDKYNLDN